MNEESILAWNIIEKTSANLFLTGKAGTGKTTFLKQLKEKSPKRMVVLAPTGIAAINAGGVTIHSFFQLPLSPYLPGTSFGGNEKKKYQFSALKRKIIRSIDLLVIDEISMVRSDLLDAVDSVLRRYRKHDLPFGGVQLLMIGDLHQLAPVVTDHEEGDAAPVLRHSVFLLQQGAAAGTLSHDRTQEGVSSAGPGIYLAPQSGA